MLMTLHSSEATVSFEGEQGCLSSNPKQMFCISCHNTSIVIWYPRANFMDHRHTSFMDVLYINSVVRIAKDNEFFWRPNDKIPYFKGVVRDKKN